MRPREQSETGEQDLFRSWLVETAAAAEFYLVRDAKTKKCTVVETKPTTTTTTTVDNGTFKTKTEAETGMKTMKVCTN